MVNEIIWAPWRADFIRDIRKKKKLKGCIFCGIIKKRQADEKNNILFRGRKNFIILNTFPYNTGHVMVVSYSHKGFEELGGEELEENFILVQKSVKIIGKALRPDGFNVGINIGRSASASIRHAHVHIVPRWVGDAGFMETTADTKVMPESLQQTYAKLKVLFDKILLK